MYYHKGGIVLARPKNIEESEKIDRSIVNLEVDMFVLKPTEILMLPETPNLYLTQEKAKKLLKELKDALDFSKEGVIIRLQGEINPNEEDPEKDGSMFLSREISTGEIKSRDNK